MKILSSFKQFQNECIGTYKYPAKSCQKIKELSGQSSGFYWLWLEEKTRVYCDMHFDEGIK